MEQHDIPLLLLEDITTKRTPILVNILALISDKSGHIMYTILSEYNMYIQK